MAPHSILVVDDSAEALDLYRKLFELDNYVVHLASSLDAARLAIQAYGPSIVVIDDDPGGIRAERVAQCLAEEAEQYGHDRASYIAIRGDMVLDEPHVLPYFDHLLLKPVEFAKLDAVIRNSVSNWLLRLAR